MRFMPWVFLITIYMLRPNLQLGPVLSPQLLLALWLSSEMQMRRKRAKLENVQDGRKPGSCPSTSLLSKDCGQETPPTLNTEQNLIIHQLPVRGLGKWFLCDNMQIFPQLCDLDPHKGESITVIWLPIMIMTVLLFIIKYYLVLKPRYRTWTLSPEASCPGLRPPPEQNFAATFWLWKDVLWVMQMIWRLNSWFLQRDFEC